jgi:ubiquinone/menaquinone biosynthesis C-methylase UbiE
VSAAQLIAKTTHDVISDSQKANRDWWSDNPMTYDWEETLCIAPGSREWFEEIDRRFMQSAYYARGFDNSPFGRFLKPEVIKGKEVLEVGCGMGTHAAMLVRAGASLAAIDLTERAIEVSKRRFELVGLSAKIQQADCENLPFSDAAFDTVWSWGVIHHSSHTERCLNEITRVLRPGGHLMIMVYYRPSIVYYINCGLIRGILGGHLLRRSLQEIYVNSSDGFYARVFTKSELKAIAEPNYENVTFNIVGLKAELFPIPRCWLKERLEDAIPDRFASSILSRWGSMIVMEAEKRR